MSQYQLRAPYPYLYDTKYHLIRLGPTHIMALYISILPNTQAVSSLRDG